MSAGPREGQTAELALHALISSARHELRAPLQSIQGFAELLASESYGSLGRDQRVFVEHVIQGSRDMSRVLDACFELLQAEVLHLPTELLRSPLRQLLDEALSSARSHAQCEIQASLEDVDEHLTVEVDLRDFSKAVEAIITALVPLARGPIQVAVTAREAQAEVTFSAVPGEGLPFRSLNELPRRGLSARPLLWLRVASSLLARAAIPLETSEGYERVRIWLPLLHLA